jgi:subfamily B ATP-binding cassette protein MsbA
MLGRAGARRKWPLADVRRKYLPYVPLVAALGVLASLLEGAGIGLFIPLLGLILADPSPAHLPQPLMAAIALLPHGDARGRTILLGGIIFGLILLKNLVQIINGRLLASIGARVGADIRKDLARSLLSVDYRFFLEHETARLTRIMATDSWFVVEAARSALAVVPAAASLLVFGALLAWLNIKLFLLVLLGAACVQGMIYLFEVRQERLSHQFTASSGLLWQRLLTLLQAPRVVRLFGQEAREQQRTDIAIERLRQSLRGSSFLTAFIHPAVDALLAVLFLTILLAGYWGGMSLPAITAFLLLLTRTQAPARTISQSRLGIASFEASLREVDWLRSQSGRAAATVGGHGDLRLDRAIVFDDVSFTYPNGHRALERISCTIEPGIATALLGESGAGKSTLVNLLCRLIEPETGEIRLGDEPAREFEPARWRSRIAVAGQDNELVGGTIAENIAYGRPDAPLSEIETVARAAGADTFIKALPEGYDTPVTLQGLSLSGGQRQRIGLARALLLNPDLLVLDEATSAVDALSDREIVKLSTEHRHFRTLLVISHRKTTVAACQRGIVLHDGRVAEAGALADLAYFERMAGTSDE